MSQLPKKVYYVWNYFEWGGAQIYFLGLIREIKQIAEIKVILPAGSDKQLIRFIENENISYEFFGTKDYEKKAFTLKSKIRLHRNKLKSEADMLKYLKGFDLSESIVHIELAPWQSLFSLAHLSLKTKVFITMHNSLPPVPKWRYLLWKTKFAILTKLENFNIFASNEDAKKSLEPLVPKKFYDRIKVTYTNVNPFEVEAALLSEIDKEKLLTEYKIPKDKFLVFCVGQFIDRKGRWTFLEAAKKVFEKDKEVAFVWIANSKPSVEDLKRTENYGLGENFVFIKSEDVGTEHIDLFKLLRLADLFALVSFQEGLPISLLEAMALGIPSISTNVNAIPEAVKHLETGWLIEAGDAANLVFAINSLKNDKELREKLSENGRDFVLANFNEKVVAKIALEGYRESFE